MNEKDKLKKIGELRTTFNKIQELLNNHRLSCLYKP